MPFGFFNIGVMEIAVLLLIGIVVFAVLIAALLLPNAIGSRPKLRSAREDELEEENRFLREENVELKRKLSISEQSHHDPDG